MSSSKKPPKKPSRTRVQATRAKTATRAAAARARPAQSRATARPAPPQKSAAPKPATVEPAAPVRRPGVPTRPGVRFAGSASSRLTIKPGPPGPRPTLELSTKARPAGPRRLSEVELDEDEVLFDGFDATLDGQRVKITAVLERTCVYVDRGGDRKLARKEELWVEADKLPIRRRGIG